MITDIWNLLFYKPLYNTLIFLVSTLPFHSMFLAVIILTIIVRIILYPFSYKAIKTQIGMSAIQGKIKEIQKTYTDKQEQAKKTMEVYKEYGVNPFSSFVTILVQFPIIIALYKVFQDFSTKGLDKNLLYSFVQKPEFVNFSSFGVHLSEKSILLALLVGISQYIYLQYSSKLRKRFTKNHDKKGKGEKEKMMEKVGDSMKYTMPIFIAFIAYIAGGALALYWLISNLFLIFQEKLIYAGSQTEIIRIKKTHFPTL